MPPSCTVVNVTSDTSADGPTLSHLWGVFGDCRKRAVRSGAARIDVTDNDGGRVGAATTTRGCGGRRPPLAGRERTWIWTPSQEKHHRRQSSLSNEGGESGTGASRLARDHEDILARYERGELSSVKAAAREANIVKASFDRTKRLLEKHANSFTAPQKAELQEILGKVEHGRRPLSR